jgi:hypothetical protein
MLEYQKRVLDENDELCARIGKLGKFLESDTFTGLSTQEQIDLHLQHSVMIQLQSILNRRISRFTYD